MPEPMQPKAVQRSCRVYERLLVLYPRNHRQEYGAAISQLFRDQCRDAWAEGKPRSLIAFWFRALVDLLKTSLFEHLSNLNRTMLMLSTFRPRFTPLSVFLPVFAAAFLLAVIGSTVITFLMPETYVSTARISLDLSYPPGFSSDVNPLEHEFQIIQSHVVLTKTIDALHLREIWGRKYNGGAPMRISKAESLLRHSLDLQPVRNTTLIEIRAFSHNPDEAARLANGVAEAYQQYSQDLRLELARRDETTSPVTRGVTIIDPAVPVTHPIAPNKPLNITFGVIVGLLLGFISGGIGAGFIVSKQTNENSSDSTLSTPSAPAAFQDSASPRPGADILMWIIGSFWISISIPFVVLIFIFVLKIGTPPFSGGNTLIQLVFLLLEASGTLTALAGFSLLRGKLWAKIYIAIAALAVAFWSAFGSLFLPNPFRWLFAAFGLASLCVLFFSRASLWGAQSRQVRLS